MSDPTRPDPAAPDHDLAAAEGAALSEAIEEVESSDAEPPSEPAADEEGAAPVKAAGAKAPASVPGGPAAPGETLPYVDDRVSKWWVAIIVATFVAIFAYAVVLGKGGLLTPIPTPSPTPTATVVPSPSPSPSPNVSPSPSPALTPTASPSPSPTAAPSTAPSATPAPTPTST